MVNIPLALNPMETIELQVDADLAKIFQNANPVQQQKVRALINIWLKRAMTITQLQSSMDNLSEEAEINGLTPEILQSILND